MRLLAIAIVSVCLCLLGCGRFGPQADLAVAVPDPPGAWARAFPDLGFEIRFPDCAGRWHMITVAGVGGTATIACSKVGNTPVLAYPVAERAAGFLRPAGGLYPADVREERSGQRLELSWHGGFLALVLARLFEQGLDTSLVNSARLAQYLDKHPDPWVLDLDAIVEKLIQGDFSAYDIDPLPSWSVSLCPGSGEWFIESPFAAAIETSDRQILSMPALSLGMHALFSVRGQRIRIWVGRSETVIGAPE